MDKICKQIKNQTMNKLHLDKIKLATIIDIYVYKYITKQQQYGIRHTVFSTHVIPIR